MKKFFILCVMCLCALANIQAQTKVILLTRKLNFTTAEMAINGGEYHNVLGQTRKNGFTKNPAITTINVNGEGKLMFGIKATYINPVNGVEKQYACEHQLSVEEGETYYLYVDYKGVDDIQIKEMSPKEADKAMKAKDLDTLESISVKLN